MAHILRTILLALVLNGSTSFAAETEAPAPAPINEAIAPAAEPLTERQQQLVDWATGRFTLAGLELPEMEIRFDPSRGSCGGADGLYRHAPDEGATVTICTRDGDSFMAELETRRTLLHEFGHAWDFANLTAGERDQLGSVLGTAAWWSKDVPWGERGAERFAETFVFALLDQPLRALKVDLGCTVMLEAFRTATGAEPQGPGLPRCAQ